MPTCQANGAQNDRVLTHNIVLGTATDTAAIPPHITSFAGASHNVRYVPTIKTCPTTDNANSATLGGSWGAWGATAR